MIDIKATTTMISFKYFFLSALFGGVIGGVLGAMLTLKIFGDQVQEHADEDEEEEFSTVILRNQFTSEILSKSVGAQHNFIKSR